MGTKTQFFQSQVGGDSVINYSYTDMPLKLMAKDIYYFFVYSWALPWILWPAFEYGSGPLDELYPTRQNLWCIGIHAVLVILQLAFLIALPFTILLPIWTAALGIGGFLLFNYLISRLLNGSSETYNSDPEFAEEKPQHAHEQWVFLNGVAVGEHWLKTNLNRLALTFDRPILGIHNQTRGIIFDVFECLIQRNYSYATSDVRITYRILKKLLYEPSKSKVVFICHSQGGIQGSLVLDWLLQELPQDLLSKLEVYTFGNAANHFNNPHRHLFSQRMVQANPFAAMNTMFEETSFESPKTSPVNTKKGKRGLNVEVPPSLPRDSSSMSTKSVANDKAIGHIEHYAHTTDFVAIWGVLHFATNRIGSLQIPRFMGRLFASSTNAGGHLLIQHYLDGMFPLEFDTNSKKFVGAKEDNDFMEELVKHGTEGTAEDNVREAFEISYNGTLGFGTGAITTPVEVHGVHKIDGVDVRVKDLSRLWSYRNGKCPEDIPPSLLTEGGVVRNATM